MRPDLERILSYNDEERIRTALAAVPETDGLSTPPRVEQAILGELRRRSRRSMLGRVAGAGAIAALVLVGLWLMRTPRPQPVIQVYQPPKTEAPTLEIVVPEPRHPDVAATAPAARVHRQRPLPQRQASSPRPAIRSEFIPVGVWQAIEPMERGSILRVRVPKSLLPGLGIPVSADRWNESVPADVVLGEDGTLRAIRLVSQWQ